MTPDQKELVKKHIPEICTYRTVLSEMLKHPVSMDQAIADWLEKGYAPSRTAS